MAQVTIFLTTTGVGTWTVPADCNLIDSIEAIGAGANGGSAAGQTGGGGGAWARTINLPIAPNSTAFLKIGAPGSSDTWFNKSVNAAPISTAQGVLAQGAPVPLVNSPTSGQAASCIGNAANSGGTSDTSRHGGGGAGGPNGPGANASGGTGGTGDAGFGGVGGGNFAAGSPGQEYDSTHGSGGGGGGISSTASAGPGGLYGGGGGSSSTGPGAGAPGLIVIKYTPVTPPTVSAVNPNTGISVGGQSVVITGTKFNSASAVTFGGVNALGFTVNSDTQITAISPSHAVSTVDVVVTNPDGNSAISASDQFTYNVTIWPDNAGFGSSTNIVASLGTLRFIRAGLTNSTSLAANTTSPLQFISVGLSPSAVFANVTFGQPKGLQASFAVASNFKAVFAAAKFLSTVLRPASGIAATATQRALLKSVLQPAPIFKPFLSQKSIAALSSRMIVAAGISPPYVNLPGAVTIHWTIGPVLGFDPFIAKYFGASLSAITGISPNFTIEALRWINYGSEVLYAEASGLEKAMIDADAPRLTQVDAEAIIDTWSPFDCPTQLLPYLAWEMGVTFWNDKWSDETKRAWVAQQWQFKALRGTDAGISMAVDFAGRDVSPYGYHVRGIITAPQGQYPSPGISHAEQEEWLATLPQVRVYLFSNAGEALADEFYINYSYMGTDLWDGQGFMTPNTATSRLGKRAVWNVHGQDVPNVGVLDFGNYFQLQMPGQAYPEELYYGMAYPEYSYITPSDAWKRLVTISPLTEAPYRIAIGPALQAVEAQPELITVPGVAGYDMFVGSNLFPHDGGGVFMAPSYQIPNIGTQLRDPQTLPAFPSFLLPSTSDYRIFNRYSVYDPDDLPTGGTQGTMFCGVGWFDYPPFTAEVDVFMAGGRCAQEFAIDDFMLPSSRYTLPQDQSSIAYVAGAIEAARNLTSLTLLQPKPTPLFSAGKPFIVGLDHYLVGQAQLSV